MRGFLLDVWKRAPRRTRESRCTGLTAGRLLPRTLWNPAESELRDGGHSVIKLKRRTRSFPLPPSRDRLAHRLVPSARVAVLLSHV